MPSKHSQNIKQALSFARDYIVLVHTMKVEKRYGFTEQYHGLFVVGGMDEHQSGMTGNLKMSGRR